MQAISSPRKLPEAGQHKLTQVEGRSGVITSRWSLSACVAVSAGMMALAIAVFSS